MRNWRMKHPRRELLFAGELGMQPGPGVSPVAVGGCCGYGQDLGRLRNCQAGEVAKLHELGFEFVHLFEALKHLIEGQQIYRRLGGGDVQLIDVVSFLLAAALAALLGACLIDKDWAHGLGRGSEEMAAIVKMLVPHETQVRFMHKCRRLQRLSGFLLSKPLARQLAKLVIYQRQKLLCGVRVALLDGGQDAGDFRHGSLEDNGLEIDWQARSGARVGYVSYAAAAAARKGQQSNRQRADRHGSCSNFPANSRGA